MPPTSERRKEEARTANIELWRLRLRRLRKAASPSVFIVIAVVMYVVLYAILLYSSVEITRISELGHFGVRNSTIMFATAVLIAFPLGIEWSRLMARTIRRLWKFCCQRPAAAEKGAWMPMDDDYEAADDTTDDFVLIRMVPSEAFLHVFCALVYIVSTGFLVFKDITADHFDMTTLFPILVGQEQVHLISAALSAFMWIVWGLISVCCQKQRKFFLSRFEVGKQAQLMMVFVLSLPIIVDWVKQQHVGSWSIVLPLVFAAGYLASDWSGHGLFIKLKEWILLRPPLPRPQRCYHRIPFFRYKLRQNVKNLADDVREETGGSQITTGEKYYFSSEQQGGPLVGYDFKEMLRELTFMTAESRMHRLILVATLTLIAVASVLAFEWMPLVPWYQNVPAVLGSGYAINDTSSTAAPMTVNRHGWWDIFFVPIGHETTPRPTTLMSSAEFFWAQCTGDSIAAVMLYMVVSSVGIVHLHAMFNQMKHPIFTAAVRLAAAQFATVYFCKNPVRRWEDLDLRYGSLSLFALVLVLEEYVATRQRYRYRFGL